jgi:7-keto-8-aminopelargonate synthetase-like enzyme
VIGALAGRGDTVFSDELNHASIVDGCRLSRAEVVVYRHLDVEHLEWSIMRHARRRSDGGMLVVTDSVFSMDGHAAPLEEIVEIAQHHSARVVVDEAHATGVLGPGGRGALAQAGLQGEVDVLVGTLGKALGSYGAYACADAQMIRYLLNAARAFIFSTAPSPPAVAGAQAALELLESRPHRVERLHANAAALRRALAGEGFAVDEGEMPIVPLVLGDERVALSLCEEAIARGVFAQAIRPPTVPAGTSRLRLAAMASHTASDMRLAATVLGEAARALGLSPAEIGAPALELSAVAGLAEAGAPYDSEREVAFGGAVTEELAAASVSASAETPARGPFDREREGSFARAA